MISCGILIRWKFGQSSSNIRKPRFSEKLQNAKFRKIQIFLKIALAGFLFRNFFITMFPCGIVSTFTVTQSSSNG